MEEFVCVTLLAHIGESQADFSARLSHFWTHLLRTRPDDFARVYAEAFAFEERQGRLTRQYLIKEEGLPILQTEWATAGVEYAPIDREETLNKYEAVQSEWMQIEH